MDNKNQSKHFTKSLSDTIELKETFEFKAFGNSTKKFSIHFISGWFSSIRKDLSPKGVNKHRVIDRKNDIYLEKITDIQTGRIIRDVKEKLTEHRTNRH